MQLDFSDISYESKVYDYEDGAKLTIRPYPMSLANTVIENEQVILTGKGQFDEFNYSLVDWEGVVDINDKPIPCNEKVKKQIYDFRLSNPAFQKLVTFVLQQNARIEQIKVEAEKN